MLDFLLGERNREPRVEVRVLPAPANDVPLLLVAGCTVEGKLVSTRLVQVMGSVDGSLRAPAVVVAQGGAVTGLLVAEVVICEGQVLEARVFADRLVLKRGCELTGEVVCRELVIEEGALFEGRHRRHGEPLSLAPD